MTESREKRTRMRGEERRASILAQAKKVFAEQGYAEASTSMLARASDVTEPMLYKHFGSKKGLFLAVLDNFIEGFIRRFLGSLEQQAERDLLEVLSMLLLDYRAAAMADPDGLRAFVQASVGLGDEQFNEFTREHYVDLYQRIYHLLEQAQGQRVLPAKLNLTAAAWGYISLLATIANRPRLNLTDQFDEEVISEISRLWLQGLRLG
ncbi:TetR/AcrR family transcriptional regulator [Ktedonosporobacter rubrisoli]|uniref:TetR/AcrR family transcriptional regulator n=1 Tax=Ktedonosporobacter rubrisoli TaxID=2509675 RepID=A0A4P6JLI1_KTERU|nr:TetR/AcrR family transcriptional regulator [Ktedonosporobacter rubrisoli]QBD76054.1 TetR/AcrR family transcriptional regulator [Ktedonosporobacter rubrisoli]